MTEISAQKGVENDRTDVPHLFGFVKIVRNPEIRSLLRYMVGIWSKFGQGRKLVKKVKIWKVLRMGLPIVENLSGLQESIFSLFRSPQLHSGEKSKQLSILIKFIDFRVFPPLPDVGRRPWHSPFNPPHLGRGSRAC